MCLRPERESPSTADQPQGSSDTTPGHSGVLLDPAGNQTLARVPHDSWSTLRDLGHGPELSWTAGRIHGLRTRVQVAQDSWSTPPSVRLARVARDIWLNTRALGHGRESAGRAGPPCGPSDTGASHPGQLVDPTGSKTLARVARDICSTPLASETELKSPGTAGRHCGKSDTSPSCLGQLVDTGGPPARA